MSDIGLYKDTIKELMAELNYYSYDHPVLVRARNVLEITPEIIAWASYSVAGELFLHYDKEDALINSSRIHPLIKYDFESSSTKSIGVFESMGLGECPEVPN